MRKGNGTMGSLSKKKKGRLSSLAVFLLVFLVFLLVFGGLCLWMVVKINQERREAGVSAPAAASSTSQSIAFTSEDERDLFLVTVDEEAQGFVAVHTDPANARIRTLAIPRETLVEVGTAEKRLFEVYASDGARQAQEAVSRLIGLTFDNYAVLTYDKAETLLGKLDKGVLFTIPEDLNYQSETPGESIQLRGGLTSLTASQVVSVLRYPTWNGGRKQQADVQAQLASAVINQYLVADRDLQADFDSFVGLLQSDIKISHFIAAKPGLEYLAARNTGSICASVSLDGQYTGSGEAMAFRMADDAPAKLEAVFGNEP